MIAEMIDLLFGRDVAVVVGIDDQVYGYGLTIEIHAAIATTTTSARGRTVPDMAGGWIVIDQESQIDDVAAVFYLLDDRTAAISHYSLALATVSLRNSARVISQSG